MYLFIKPLPVRDEQSDSCPSIDYKPPLVSIKDKDNEILTQGETYRKNGKTNEPNNRRETNEPNIPVLNEYGCIFGAFLLPPQ